MSVNYRHHITNDVSKHLIFKVLPSRYIICHLCPQAAEGSFPYKQTPERNSTLKMKTTSFKTMRTRTGKDQQNKSIMKVIHTTCVSYFKSSEATRLEQTKI